MTRDFFALAEWVNNSTEYYDIFRDEDTRAMYIKLAQILHPDKQPGGTDRRQIATEAFQKLNDFHAQAQQALTEGRFGEPIILATIRSRHALHEVKHKLGQGDIATLFQVETTDDTGGTVGLLKVAKNARDNDLLAAEAKALKALHADDHPLTRYYPKLLDTFMYQDGRRRANVITWQDDCYNLEELRRKFPSGLPPVHVAWVWRRLLQALEFAHDHDLIHGAVLPPHVLVLPKQHGVILVDWCYSVGMGVSDPQAKTIKAVVSKYRDWYPNEVTDKIPPTPATDIVMAARTMIWLLGGDPITGELSNRIPRGIRAWFKGCLIEKQAMRPDHAGKLCEEFDALLKRLGEPWYPRRFVELVIPT